MTDYHLKTLYQATTNATSTTTSISISAREFPEPILSFSTLTNTPDRKTTRRDRRLKGARELASSRSYPDTVDFGKRGNPRFGSKALR